MTRPVAVLRPEPGNGATAAQLEAVGLATIRMPLFAVRPLPWAVPPGEFDALVLTSANAVRMAGPLPSELVRLPVHAVGAATARAARDAGLSVATVGSSDAVQLLALAHDAGMRRGLLLSAPERRVAEAPGIAAVAEVYRADPVAIDPAALRLLKGAVALVHSPRAARRLAELLPAPMRARVAIVAISAAAADAVETGWEDVAVADRPADAAMVALARRLAD